MSTINWALAGSGLFSTGANWVGGAVPGASDDVILDDTGAGEYVVESFANATVNSVRTGAAAEQFAVEGGTFTATAGTGTGSFDGVIYVQAATFVVGGALAFTGSGAGLSIGAGGTVQLAADTTVTGGLVEFSGGAASLTGAYTLTLGSNIAQANGATATLGAGMSIILNGADIDNQNTGAGALTIDTAVISGAGGIADFGAGGVIINGTTVQGTGGILIEANDGVVTLDSVDVVGAQFRGTNGGAIVTGDLGTMLDGRTAAVVNDGVFQIAGATALTIEGAIDNYADASIAVAQNGVLYVAATGASLAQAGEILLTGGVVAGAAPGATLDNIDNTISGIGFIEGPLSLTNGATGLIDAAGGRLVLSLAGATVTNDGLIEATGTSGLLLARGDTIDSSGGGGVVAVKEVMLDNTTLLGGSLTIQAGGEVLTFVGDTAHGSVIDLGGGTVSNAGELLGAAGGLTVDGDVANTGLVIAESGPLTITGDVTGTGKVEVFGKGTLEIDGAQGGTVAFGAGATGKLVLGDSQAFTGAVTGFSKTGATAIDLRDIVYGAGDTVTYKANKAINSGGTLTVSDGTHTTTIKLAGTSYSGSTFTLSQDSGTGTIVVDPKAHAFAAAMAGFAVSGADHPVRAAPAAANQPLIATPGLRQI